MRQIAEKYYKTLVGLIDSTQVTSKNGNALDFYQGIECVGNLIISKIGTDRKLIFIGNGASAAISSHMATDFWKNGGIRAVAFNDSSLLTCIGNDYGMEFLFEKPIQMFADPGDALIAISSSGRSVNILKGVQAAQEKGCQVITLSGFKADNPLRFMGDFNFYVPAENYGPVEIFHHSICHCILDVIMLR